jgi:capsular polysaccharide biosynthesis protein
MVTAVRRHWALAGLAAIAAFLGCVLALALVPSTYTATSVVAMVPRPESEAGADLLLLTIPNYAALATSETTATDLGDEYGEAPEKVQAAIQVDNPPASNTVLVSVGWDDPEMAARLANRVTDVIVQAAATDSVLSAEVIAEATPPTVASWPPWGAGLVLGGLLSLGVGVAVARFAERRRQVVAEPGEIARLVEGHGLRAPVLLAVPEASDAVVGFLARVVERALQRHRGVGTAHVGFLAVGRDSADRLAVAAGVAAALDRKDRRVLVALDEREGGSVRRTHLHGLAGPGRLGAGTPAAEMLLLSGPDAGTDGRPGTADVVLVVSDRLERVIDQIPEGSLAGVVTVVLPNALTHELRTTLRAVGESATPHLGVVHWLQPAESTKERLTGAPSRAASVRDDAPRELGPALPSAGDTSRSS